MNLIFSNEDYYISGIENVFKTKKQATGNNDDNWSYKLVFSVAMSDFEEWCWQELLTVISNTFYDLKDDDNDWWQW